MEMEPKPANIIRAEITRNSTRIHGVAPDYTIIPKKTIVEQIREPVSLTLFCLTGIIFSILAYPLLLASFVIFAIIPRIIITLYAILTQCGCKINILYGEKSFTAAGQDTHIFVQVIQGQCDIGKLQEYFSDLLAKETFLQETVFRKYGYFCSTLVDNINIQDHVKYYSAKSQSSSIREEDILLDLETNILGTDFSKSEIQRPNWEVLVIPKYLSSGCKNDDSNQYALVYRFSNSCLDLSKVFAFLCDEVADDTIKVLSSSASSSIESVGPEYSESNTKLTITRVKNMTMFIGAILLGPIFVFRSLLRKYRAINIVTSENDKESSNKASQYFSMSKQYNMEALHSMKDTTKTSFDAILLSSVGTSVRNLLLGFNYECPDLLSVSYRTNNYSRPRFFGKYYADRSKITKFNIEIGLDLPIKRLHSALNKSNSEKHIILATEELANYFMQKIVGLLPAFALTRFHKRFHRANMNVEYLSGPTERLKILDNNIVDIYAWSVKTSQDVSPSAELRTNLVNYCGKLRSCYSGSPSNFSCIHMPTLKREFDDEIFKIAGLCALDRRRLT